MSGSKVKVQKNINGQLDVFAIQLLSNQVSRGWKFSQLGFEEPGFQPVRFRGVGDSANQMLLVSHPRRIRFRGAGSLANQVSRCSEFIQSGFEGLEIRPIRFRGAGSSAKQVSGASEFSQSGFEGLGVQ